MDAIKEKDLRKRVRKALAKMLSEEDIRDYRPENRGIYDQPIEELETEPMTDQAQDREEYPVGPSPDAQMQLTQQIPDIENLEYVPANSKELQRALHALGEKIPESQIRDIYRKITDLVTVAIDKDYDETVQIKEVSNLPHSVRTTPLPGRSTIDQRAAHTGVGSIAQQATFENRLLKKIKNILLTAEDAQIDVLLNASVEAYMAVMKDAGNMSPEDIEFFMEKPSRMEQLKDSDLFRSFVGNAILQQGMRKIRLGTEKAIEAEIQNLGLPKGGDLTVKNHVMGNTALTYQKFLNLLGKKAANDKSFDSEKMFDLSKKMPNILRSLRKIADDVGSKDLIPLAFEEWVKSSKDKKVKLLTKAAQDLANLYDAENKI